MYIFALVESLFSHQKTSRGWIFFLGLVDPSRNRLVPTAYFVIHQYKMKNFKSGQIYMKDAECAESKGKSIFQIFIFQVKFILVLKIWSIFDEFSPITQKNINRKISLFRISFGSAHPTSFIKI